MEKEKEMTTMPTQAEMAELRARVELVEMLVKKTESKDLKEIANEIRKDFFRKKDQTPQVIGSVFGVIALISAMTAIIQPMNRSISDLRKEIQAVENRLDQRIKDKDAYNLTIMDNAHKRLNALESGDQEDKTVNAMVMMQEDRIKTLEVRTLADRTNHAKIDMLYMHFVKDHDKGGI